MAVSAPPKRPRSAHPARADGAEALIEEARRRTRRRRQAYAAASVFVVFAALGVWVAVGRGGGNGAGLNATAGPGPAGAGQTASSGDHRVTLGHSIGSYSYDRHRSYRDAVTIFGPPTSRRVGDPGVCDLSWPRQGLVLMFRTPATEPCSSDGLAQATFTGARILSPVWNVDRDVHVGDSWQRIRRLYPSAPPMPMTRGSESGWVLVQRAVPQPSTRYVRYMDLAVFVAQRRVVRLELYYS